MADDQRTPSDVEGRAPGPRSSFIPTFAIGAAALVLVVGSLAYVAIGLGDGTGAILVVVGLGLVLTMFGWAVGRTRGWFR